LIASTVPLDYRINQFLEPRFTRRCDVHGFYQGIEVDGNLYAFLKRWIERIFGDDVTVIVLDRAKERFPRLKKIWADSRYACKQTPVCVRIIYGWVLEIVSRVKGVVGFAVLPRRWVVERTFGWFVLYRRLSKDYERNPRVSETMVYVAMIHLMLRRLRPA
jgi:transposase